MVLKTTGTPSATHILKKGYAGNYSGYCKLEIEYVDSYIKTDRLIPGSFSNVIYESCKNGIPSQCGKVKTLLKTIIPHGSTVCTVPSSTAGKIGHLDIMLNEISSECGFQVLPLIKRYRNKEKAAFGGDRSLIAQYRTLECAPKTEIEGRDIILMDDISTTGNSIFACKKLLEKNGAMEVRIIVLGRTV